MMNIPNSLSLTRICLIPLFIAAYFLPYEWGVYVAIAIFFVCCFTDFLDGFIARKYNMVTDLGKLLDPIADPPCPGRHSRSRRPTAPAAPRR